MVDPSNPVWEIRLDHGKATSNRNYLPNNLEIFRLKNAVSASSNLSTKKVAKMLTKKVAKISHDRYFNKCQPTT
jgi:hypothetical protein